MILDVFPSYKDKNMVDSLYRFERATGLSLNILVEKYLEKMLYEKGYLNNNENVQDPIRIMKPAEKFKTNKYSNGNVQLVIGDLLFGTHSPEMVDKLKSKLTEVNDDELINLSKNNSKFGDSQYKVWLYYALEILPSEDKSFIQDGHRGGKYQVRIPRKGKQINFGTYNSLKQAKEVRNFVISKNFDEKYSTNHSELKGKKYYDWLFSEIEKEKKVEEIG